MVREAEDFADEDRKVRERIDAKNAFESYLRSMRSTDSLKMTEEEKEQIAEALKDGEAWLEENQEASAFEIKEKQQEIEGTCAPLVAKYYGGAGGSDYEEEGADDEL